MSIAALLVLAAGTTVVVTEAPLMRIVVATDQPMRVVAIRAEDESSALVVEVENQSQKQIWSATLMVAPAECPRSDHPGARLLRFPNDVFGSRSPSRMLRAGERTTLLFSAVDYQGLLKYQMKAGCREEARPDLILRTVAFCDGTGWEGFADGPAHSVWAGRAWIPPERPQCESARGPTKR